MRRVIHLFGASGAGTSTIGRYICEKTGCYFMDTDDYFWKPTDPPFTEKRPRPERIELMKRDLGEHENVVISGSLTDWGDGLIPFFTLAVRVETAAPIRLERLERRERERFGARLDPGGDMYETHLEFMEWASSYDNGGIDMRSMAKHDEWQKLLPCPVVFIDGGLPVETNWEIIKRRL